jgi:hypothetical protein
VSCYRVLPSITNSSKPYAGGYSGAYSATETALAGVALLIARPQDGNNDGAAICDIGAFERR